MRYVLLFLLSIAAYAMGADEPGAIQTTLSRFNGAMQQAEPQSLRAFFVSNADYRDASRVLKGPDALIALFANRQMWSERTAPSLQEVSIRLVGRAAAFVDAQLVQYGSTIVKSSVPVVLLLEKEAGAWKIASWRTSTCLFTPTI